MNATPEPIPKLGLAELSPTEPALHALSNALVGCQMLVQFMTAQQGPDWLGVDILLDAAESDFAKVQKWLRKGRKMNQNRRKPGVIDAPGFHPNFYTSPYYFISKTLLASSASGVPGKLSTIFNELLSFALPRTAFRRV